MIKIKEFIDNIFLRLNWKLYHATLFSIITFISIFPLALFLPEQYAFENSLIENIQLIILFILFVIAISAPKNKKLFNWIVMISIILLLREINCGRIFFPIEGSSTPLFKSWKNILSYPYCYAPTILYGLFMLYSIFYFFKSKAYLELLNIIKFAKIDCVNIIFMFIGMILGTLSEINFHNEVLEETTETLFYVSFTVLVYLYGYNKDYEV